MPKIARYFTNQASGVPFLDIWTDTEYYYSLNRGGSLTTDVVQGRNSGASLQDFTPEELEDGTLATFAAGNEVRISALYNQGSVSRDMVQSTASNMPNLYNGSDLYKFNDKMYMSGVERNSYLATADASSILDKDSTVYIVFKSQNAADNEGIFEEFRESTSNRIAVYSDTRAVTFAHSNYAPTGSTNLMSFPSQQPQETIRLYALRRTGSLVEAFDENGFVDSITSADTFSANTALELFRQNVGFLNHRGHIAELIIREQADDTTTLNDIINHRKTYYGI